MGYDHDLLFRRLCTLLFQMPRTTLSEMSRQLGVERHTLRRLIVARTEKNFRELRRDLLLSRTRELLADGPQWTLKEISYMLGYQSPRSFNRFVKARTGQSPSELRCSRPKVRARTDDNAADNAG